MQIIPILQDDINTIITIPFEDNDIEIKIKYLSIVQMWSMNITYKDTQINGIKLSCGVPHLRAKNLPFDFVLENNLRNGFDPYQESDMSDGSYTLYLLERVDMNELRGHEVE